jgi:hypothetical protein
VKKLPGPTVCVSGCGICCLGKNQQMSVFF